MADENKLKTTPRKQIVTNRQKTTQNLFFFFLHRLCETMQWSLVVVELTIRRGICQTIFLFFFGVMFSYKRRIVIHFLLLQFHVFKIMAFFAFRKYIEEGRGRINENFEGTFQFCTIKISHVSLKSGEGGREDTLIGYELRRNTEGVKG